MVPAIYHTADWAGCLTSNGADAPSVLRDRIAAARGSFVALGRPNPEIVMGEEIQYRLTRELPTEGVVTLYRANGWSSAEKPSELLAALTDSHSLITAWIGDGGP